MASTKLDEKIAVSAIDHSPTSGTPSIKAGTFEDSNEDREVFKKDTDGVEFRTVTWQRATIIFVKYTVATGILSIPSALNTLGAVGGALNVVGWGAMNACESCAMVVLNILWLR
jgi:hypothetical protein